MCVSSCSPVYSRKLPDDQLSVLPQRQNFRQTVAANQATDHPSQDLDSTFSTSATLSRTSLTHNSGTTFRNWVSIGLTSVVNAIPAGENADQCFAGVPPPRPRRTHRFPVATIFSHWFACSGCKTCLFHCYFDQKQACSRSSPFDFADPRAFFLLWQLERSWIFAIGRQMCKHPIFFVLHCTLCCHRLLCRKHLLLTHRTLSNDGLSVSPPPESTTRGFGNGAQPFC